ncbi:MAG: DegT/DnrJ/EryC1/StrS family aminotransferase, partial [Phycisphaerales bacterium]|nr:DegT/DnrJ/EryC1/StrS family aminotransferase [Phycisphaerales bacterium]
MTQINVTLLDLKAQYDTIRDEIEPVVRKVIEDQWFIMGPEVKALESELQVYSGVKHAVGCASGSDAVLLACMAVGVGPGDQVILPTYTFFATAGSVARLGATPVFADIDPVTYNMDIEHTRRLAKDCNSLKAIMPVHLFGQAVDMTAWTELGTELGVPVIEDAAQAVGTRDNDGAMAGTRGTIGCFSFFPSKNLGCFGDGGFVTTNDDELAAKLSILRLHGGKPKYYHSVIGFNSRLDALQAAVLRVKLRHLDAWHAGRNANADQYDRLFAERGAFTNDTPIPTDWADRDELPIRTPLRPTSDKARHIFNQYVLRVPGAIRDDLRAHLNEHTIGNEVYYP